MHGQRNHTNPGEPSVHREADRRGMTKIAIEVRRKQKRFVHVFCTFLPLKRLQILLLFLLF